MSEVYSYVSDSSMCKHFVAVELINSPVFVSHAPDQENLRLTPVFLLPVGNGLSVIKNLPISKGCIELVTRAGSPMVLIQPGESAKSLDNGAWIVEQQIVTAKPVCDCGSRVTYGEGGPHAHWCQTKATP